MVITRASTRERNFFIGCLPPLNFRRSLILANWRDTLLAQRLAALVGQRFSEQLR
jgi:hypothetical protein